MIRFLHGEREVVLDALPADTTILAYLRDEVACTGTKEGCASGDCGACTVVVASADGERLNYRPVNACIAPVGALHGKQLITVENLGDSSTWHPVQRAMVACHGSQCGFCTPGFIMSLFALYHRCLVRGSGADREEVLEALGGNLCRCTGYRPIIDAALAATAEPEEDRFSRRERLTIDTLHSLEAAQREATALQHGESVFYRPDTPEAVADLLALESDARLVAGATDLFLERTQALKALPKLIDVTAVPALQRIEIGNDVISLGAAVTHESAQALVLEEYPELAELLERFGSRQIRAQGTVAGNIANASPIGDWPPVLLALGASLTLTSRAGSRQLPLEEFFLGYRDTALGPGEYIRSVELPRRDRTLFLRAYKISKRYEDDISSLCAVFALTGPPDEREARVACGGMDAVPRRASACEVALSRGSLDDSAFAAAAEAIESDFRPISDVRASADYRRRVAANLLRRLQLELGGAAARAHPVHGVEAHG